MIDHDRLVKELLTTFFVEFLNLFFPEVLRYLDTSRLEFLDKELFTDVTSGDTYEADIVVKAAFREQPAFFSIHVEHQAQAEEAFDLRMFRYFALEHFFINGYFTVEAARIAGTAILANEYTTMQQRWYTLGGVLASAPAMWLVHILFSLIEGNGWRDLRGTSALIFLAVIILDISTTFVGLSAFLDGSGQTVTGLAQAGIIVGALFLALAPEPIIVDRMNPPQATPF